MADEPTGNLDSANGERILQLLHQLNSETGVAVLVATHASEVAAAAHRTVHLRDGRIHRIEHKARAAGNVPGADGTAPDGPGAGRGRADDGA